MAVLRRVAMMAGPVPIRALWPSSRNVTSWTWCRLFSMSHSLRANAAGWASVAGRLTV